MKIRILRFGGVVSLFALIPFICLAQEPATHGLLPLSTDGSRELLSISGSNTIGAQLAPAWAESYLTAKGVKGVSRTNRGYNETRISGTLDGKHVHIVVKAHGSSTGFKALASGEADIGISSRAIKDAEWARLQSLGDMRSYRSEHVVAIDGLAVIVNARNPVDALSVAQIGDIFSGKIKNWQEVGGVSAPIELHARDHRSGTWDTFKSLVLRGGLRLSAAATRYESNDDLSAKVSVGEGAIGFVGLSSVGDAKVLGVVDGDAAPLQPSPIFVATEDYPLSRRLFIYTPETSRPLVAEFVRYVLREAGQDIVKDIGFVSQNPVALQVKQLDGPPFYKALGDHGARLSMNFRFHSGSAVLDSKARRDVKRLAEYLSEPQHKGYSIQLVGFSDTRNTSALARVLSKLRASAVKQELFKYGIATEPVEGYGADRLVAATGSKNDRVEVWLYPSEAEAAINKLKPQAEMAVSE